MSYNNRQIVTAIVSKWMKPLAGQVLSSRLGALQPIVSASEWIKKYFPVSQDYSLVNDLSFLAEPAIEIMAGPVVNGFIDKLGVDDTMLPIYMRKIVRSCIEECNRSGKVSLFDMIELERQDFERLMNMVEKNLPVTQLEPQYNVIE